jgi:hypothetical protein
MFLDWTKLQVQPGDEVLPAWEEMRRAVRGLRLLQGMGIQLTDTPMGTTISAEGGNGAFSHPFTAALSGSTMTFSKGLVSNIEPLIGGTPISGDAAGGVPQPELELEAAQMDAGTLQSWACVEVTPKADGTLDPKTPPVVAHRDVPVSTDPALGRHPLALILWAGGVPSRMFQVTYFNLRYYRTTPGQGVAQHFFL